jgi:hypothetical protein
MQTYTAIILGYLWMPMALASTVRTYRAENDEQAVLEAQTTEAGDFSQVVDVCVYRIEGIPGMFLSDHAQRAVPVKLWDNEETESDYWDTVAD